MEQERNIHRQALAGAAAAGLNIETAQEIELFTADPVVADEPAAVTASDKEFDDNIELF